MEAGYTGSKFMVIDDDPANNYICSKFIKIVSPGAEITTFTIPEKGLEAILATSAAPQETGTLLLLDINMPVLSGWDVLDRFSSFPEAIKKQYTIYILSSSISPDDKNKADANPLVSGFVEKPLSVARLKGLLGDSVD